MSEAEQEKLNAAFDQLEKRIARMGAAKIFTPAERAELGWIGYEAELEMVETQEVLHLMMVRLWDRQIPKFIIKEKPYPLTEADISGYRSLIDYDHKWRLIFSKMLADAPLEYWLNPPALPNFLTSESVTSKLPSYQAMVDENGLVAQWKESVESYWHFNLYNHIESKTKLSQVLAQHVLNVHHAQLIADVTVGRITLKNLCILSPSVAAVLMQARGGISFDGLLSISPQTAQALLKAKPELSLNGLVELSQETAAVLSQYFLKPLYLNGLKHLSLAAAEALAGAKTNALHLNGLVKLEADAAKKLFYFEGELLSLNGLCTLDLAYLDVLKDPNCFSFRQTLKLDGLIRLSAPEAQALIRSKAKLSLNGLTVLPMAVLKILLDSISQISLRGLKQIPVEQLTLVLESDKLKVGSAFMSVSGDRAYRLEVKDTSLSIYTTDLGHDFTEAVAKLKKPYSWSLCFYQLKTIGVDSARILGRFEGKKLSFVDLISLSVEAAEFLGHCKGRLLQLNALKTLPSLVAQHLACFGGRLELNGLSTITQETLALLSHYRGFELSLNGLTSAPDRFHGFKAARLSLGLQRLSYCRSLLRLGLESLAFPAIRQLDVDTAQFLSESQAQKIRLNGLSTLSAEVARVLVRYPGVIGLNGLKYIDGKVAKILAPHRDRIETNGVLTRMLIRHRPTI